MRSAVAIRLGLLLLLHAAGAESDWHGWGGPHGDFTLDEAGLLTRDRPIQLSVVWRRPLGSGYSAVSVAEGMAVTTFSDGESDFVIALEADDGRERWRYRIGPTFLGHYGSQSGPPSTPLLMEGRVVVLGPRGGLLALDAASGESLWSVDLVAAHGAVAPEWGFTSSPRGLDGRVLLQTGGRRQNAVSAFDVATGRVLWSAATDSVEYQSASLSRRTQPPQLLFQGHHTLQGLDPLTGDVLWRFRHGGQGNAVSTSTHPVEIAKGRYFLKNHGDGGVLVRVGSDDGAWSAEEVWRTRHIRSTYIYAVAHAQRIYGYAGRILTAVDGATGERLWRSREPGDGLPAVIDSHLVIVTKDGSLSVAPAAADGYRESARLQLFDDIAWSPVSVADGRLYARSMSEIACVEVVPASVAAPSQVAPPLTLAAESLFGRFLTAVEVAADKAGVVDKFLDGQSSFPIVESDSLVHFVYRGAADEVSLTGDLVGWRYEQPLRRLEGTDLFYHTARVAADARTTYRFTVDLTRPEADPLNPRRLSSTFFGSASWFTMPSWTAPPHLQPLPGAEASRLDSLRLTGSDGGERLQVYLPAGYGEDRDRRYPVVYVHARGASSSWQLEGALDHLIGRRVQPLLVVFVPSLAGGEYEEYVGPLRETYLRRFVTEVVPRVDAEYRTVVDREGRANVGMMYGGAMAYYATLSHPEQFSRLAIQSLYWDATAQAAMGALLAPADRLPPLRIYLDWGRYDLRSPTEGLDIRRSTEDLARQLAQAGYAPAGGMASDGSGWESWRNRTDALFESLFPMQ